MPVSTKVKCVNCGRLADAADVTVIAGVITHCTECRPKSRLVLSLDPIPEPESIPIPEPDHGREPVTEDFPATDPERRAALQEAPILEPSGPRDGVQVKVPAGGGDDPERTCGPVEIVEEDGERMFNEVLPAPELDQLRKRLQDARMRLVVLRETIVMVSATPEVKLLAGMVDQAIKNL